MKLNKILSVMLVGAMTISCIAGCGTDDKKQASSDGKITISVGEWPEKGTEAYDTKMEITLFHQ